MHAVISLFELGNISVRTSISTSVRLEIAISIRLEIAVVPSALVPNLERGGCKIQ